MFTQNDVAMACKIVSSVKQIIKIHVSIYFQNNWFIITVQKYFITLLNITIFTETSQFVYFIHQQTFLFTIPNCRDLSYYSQWHILHPSKAFTLTITFQPVTNTDNHKELFSNDITETLSQIKRLKILVHTI